MSKYNVDKFIYFLCLVCQTDFVLFVNTLLLLWLNIKYIVYANVIEIWFYFYICKLLNVKETKPNTAKCSFEALLKVIAIVLYIQWIS